MRIKGGIYLTPEQYRRLIGYQEVQNIYKACREGRIPGALKIGKTWIIPQNAVMIDNSITHGGYAMCAKMKADYKRRQEMFAKIDSTIKNGKKRGGNSG